MSIQDTVLLSLSSSPRYGKVNAKPLPLLRFSGPSHVPLYPHSRTRSQDPSLGVRTHFLLGADSPSVSCWEPWPPISRCWSSSQPLHTRLRTDQVLKVTSRWCHQDYIICKKQRWNYQPTKLQPLSSATAPWNPVHEYHKQDKWQGATLAEANPYWEQVQLTAENPDTALALGVQRSDGPE